MPGFWVAAGFCATGSPARAASARSMAEWIVDGQPEYDVWHMDLKRFGRHYRSQRYTLARTYEGLSKYYDIKYPAEERKSARPLRVSPAYPRLAALDAAFGEKAGWERVNWFASNEADGDEALRPRGWAGQVWSPAIGAEALATRHAAGIFDQSSFSKLEVLGPGRDGVPGAARANAIDRPRRLDRLHAAAEPARRHRVRPVGDPPRGRPLPARHGHGVRRPRPRAGSSATCPPTAPSTCAT